MSAATEFIIREARVVAAKDGCKLMNGKEISFTDLVVEVAETSATGERVKVSTLSIEAWGRAAEAANALAPGATVTLCGRVRGSQYVSNKTGETVYRTHLMLRLPVVTISAPAAEEQQAPQQRPAQQAQQRPAYGGGTAKGGSYTGGGYRGGYTGQQAPKAQAPAPQQPAPASTEEENDIPF